MFDIDTLMRIHEKMHRAVEEAGGRIEAVFFCPHGPDDACQCRKPRPGLLREIAARLRIDLKGVPVVGDSLRDLQAAQAVGAKPILVRSGKGLRTLATLGETVPCSVHADLSAVADALIATDPQSN